MNEDLIAHVRMKLQNACSESKGSLLDEAINVIDMLQERIAYLERSNDRREDKIIEYEMLETPILDKLEFWLIDEFNKSQDTIYLDVLIKMKELKESDYDERI